MTINYYTNINLTDSDLLSWGFYWNGVYEEYHTAYGAADGWGYLDGTGPCKVYKSLADINAKFIKRLWY